MVIENNILSITTKVANEIYWLRARTAYQRLVRKAILRPTDIEAFNIWIDYTNQLLKTSYLTDSSRKLIEQALLAVNEAITDQIPSENGLTALKVIFTSQNLEVLE